MLLNNASKLDVLIQIPISFFSVLLSLFVSGHHKFAKRQISVLVFVVLIEKDVHEFCKKNELIVYVIFIIEIVAVQLKFLINTESAI